MGCFDSILVPCPKCGKLSEFQSKGSENCCQRCYTLGKDDIPKDVLSDVNRHAPNICQKCGQAFAVDLDEKPVIRLRLEGDYTAKAVTWPHSEPINPPILLADMLELNDWPRNLTYATPICCATCKHWKPYGLARGPYLDWGLCRRSEWPAFAGKLQVSIDSYLLRTHKDFGCTEFFPKDDGTNPGETDIKAPLKKFLDESTPEQLRAELEKGNRPQLQDIRDEPEMPGPEKA